MINLIVIDRKGKIKQNFSGKPQDIFEEMDFLSEFLEKRRIFWVKEEKIDPLSYIREFATEDEGYFCSIITYKSQANHITNAK